MSVGRLTHPLVGWKKILEDFWEDVSRGNDRIGNTFPTETIKYPEPDWDGWIFQPATIEDNDFIEDEQGDKKLHRHSRGSPGKWAAAVNQKPRLPRRKLLVELNDVTDVRVLCEVAWWPEVGEDNSTWQISTTHLWPGEKEFAEVATPYNFYDPRYCAWRKRILKSWAKILVE